MILEAVSLVSAWEINEKWRLTHGGITLDDNRGMQIYTWKLNSKNKIDSVLKDVLEVLVASLTFLV